MRNVLAVITDHRSQITVANIIVMRKFEILPELPKCDRDLKLASALGKMVPLDLLDQRVATELQPVKEHSICKVQ